MTLAPVAPAPESLVPAPRRRRPRKAPVRAVAIAVAMVIITLPVVWMFAAAFKGNVQVSDPSVGLIFAPTSENFSNVMADGAIPRAMLNSFTVAALSTLLSALLAVPAAWAVGRFRMHRTGSVVLIARIVPAVSLLVPWYYLFAQAGLVGTYTSLVLSHMFVSVPLILWIMISFFEGLPDELEEAARVDGLSTFGAFLRIALPLSAPGLTTAAVLAFVGSWNNFMFALILSDESTETLPVVLFSFISYAGTDWGGLMAAASITTAPVIVVALLAQRYIVAGLTAGATKG